MIAAPADESKRKKNVDDVFDGLLDGSAASGADELVKRIGMYKTVTSFLRYSALAGACEESI